MAVLSHLSMGREWQHGQELEDPLASVLQELLLALLGHCGDVFIRTEAGREHASQLHIADPSACNIRVAEDLDWIRAPDREYLNDLVVLGFHHAELEAFVTASRAPSQRSSLMLRALASGLTELLDVYRAAVLKVQQDLRRIPTASLASLRHSLHEFKVLLPVLHQLAAQIAAEGLAGAPLLRLLHAKANSGMPAMHACAGRLLWHCNQVLLSQAASWMAHGVLPDTSGDFFVARAPSAGDARDGLRQEGADAAAGQALDEAHAAEWHHGFQVIEAALPPGISRATAQSVLFIGKAVRMLQRPSLTGGAPGSRRLQTGKWAAELRRLAAAPSFQRLEFEQAVQGMHGEVAAWLWSLVVGRARLAEHLAALRSYFLLARGDFWQAFLLETRPMMELPPRLATADWALESAFAQAAAASSAEGDSLLGNVRIRYAPPAVAKDFAEGTATGLHVPALDQWDGLCLEYRLQWPLHIILTPEALARYNALFRHLLRLRRVAGELDEAWTRLGRRSSARGGRQRAQHALWLLRARAASLVTNLLVYMQADVVEAQSAELDVRMAAACDFKGAESASAAFLKACVQQCFLDARPLAAALEGIYALCRRVCILVRRDAEAAQARERLPGLGSETALLTADFRARAAGLYVLLQNSELLGGQHAPGLRQLLLRLNFNGHAEREAAARAGPGDAEHGAADGGVASEPSG